MSTPRCTCNDKACGRCLVHQPEDCGHTSSDYGSYGYPCTLEKGHNGSHFVLDKDDCGHYFDR